MFWYTGWDQNKFHLFNVINENLVYLADMFLMDSPGLESESESEVAQSCLTLRDPMDCSLPGSSVHGIFQARVLEWGAIAFSAWSRTYS